MHCIAITEENINAIEYFSNILKDPIPGNIIIHFSIALLIIFIIRLIMSINLEKSIYKKKSDGHFIFITIINWFMEFAIAYLISFLLVKLTDANPKNYILNIIIIPLASYCASIFLCAKFIRPLTDKIYTKKSEKKSDALSSDNKTEVKSASKPMHIDTSIIDSDNFEITIVNSINQIKDDQYELRQKINDNNKSISSTLEILIVLKSTEITDKKLSLKSAIYECLNQGYATPKQNDKITMEYQSYKALGGNGEITSLYENHYLKLDVHEDRRDTRLKYDISSDNDDGADYLTNKRFIINNCEYGKFD